MRGNRLYNNPDKTAVSLLIIIAIIMASLLAINIFQGKDSEISLSPSLTFLVSGEEVQSVYLEGMEENLKVHKIVFKDPMYEKEKRYDAFALADVLELGFGEKWKSSEFTDVAFEALDGYTAISTTSTLQKPEGYIVFKDLDYEDWEPISNKGANPGPFYVVWTQENQTTANEYPWPWQLTSMNLIKFEDQYSAVIPVGVSEDSSVYGGYEIFKDRCVRCHSMNGEGGSLAPDLNAPQSITTYRNEYMIKEFIRNPSKYRHTQMPDHPDLSEQSLDDIIAYFNYMDEIRN